MAPDVSSGQPGARGDHRLAKRRLWDESREAWRRIRSIEGRETLESGLDEEMRFHIDQQTEKHRQAGMGPAEARRLARLKFGGMEGVEEIARDEIRPALLEDSVRDVRHGASRIAPGPAFTAAALLTLALGIGATSAIFSVVRTVLLRAAAVPRARSDRGGVGNQPRRHQSKRHRAGELRRLA